MTSRALTAAVFAVAVASGPFQLAAQPAALPQPDLSGLEEGVQERLGDALAALDSTLETAAIDAAELGRAYGQTGRIFHAHHVLEVARACYAEAADLDPENPLWPYLLGFLHLDAGRFGEAERRFEGVLEIDPNHILARFRLGHTKLQQGQTEEARKILEGISDSPRVGAAAQADLGKIAESQERLQDALRYYADALALQPEALRLHYPLALVYRRLGDVDTARRHAEQAAQVRVLVEDEALEDVGSLTASSEMYLSTAAQAVKAGRLDLAERAYRGAIEANPDNARAHVNLAVVLQGRGALEEADASARRALDLSPTNFFAHFNLALILEDLERPDEARTHFEAALEADPANLKANLRYGNSLMRAARYRDAAQRYRAARDRAPGMTQAK